MEDYSNIMQRLGYAATTGETGIMEAIEFAAGNGFSAVELNINVPVFFPEKYSSNERKKIKRQSAEKNIAITLHAPEDICLMQPHRIMRKAGLERLKEVIDFAEDIGAHRVTFHVGSSVYFTLEEGRQYLHQVYPEEFREVLRDSLREIRDYSIGKKPLPCIENAGYFDRAVVQEVLDKFLSQEMLYLTWDLGHSYRNPEQEAFMLKYKHLVRNCHVHDHDGLGDHKVIGNGRIDFLEYINLLKENDAYFILEVRPREKACLSLERFKELFKKGAE